MKPDKSKIVKGQMKYVIKLMEMAKKEGKKEMLKDEIEFLESFAEKLILGKRKVGQHKFNKINIKERLTQLKQRLGKKLSGEKE